jgi:bacteriocin biosynthesis cyclodehydratase domain-containing protein
LSAADIWLVAAWKPVSKICETVDNFIHKHDRPFISVVLDSSALIIGPIVVPRKGGCWSCWQARVAQHSTSRRDRSSVLHFYEANPQAGPKGYLAPFAMMGAAQVVRALHSPTQLEGMAGYIWRIDLFTREVTTSRLVGVDGCARCGLKREVESRTYLEMQDQLAFLSLNPNKAE